MSTDPASLLRQHGLPVTAQRIAVLEAIQDLPHCTADQVAERVRARIGSISRQAVYDALKLLTEKGLIRRIHLAGSAALYERQRGDRHHHLICRGCGKAVDVECAADGVPLPSAVGSAGFRIEEVEVIFWCTCPECLAETREAGKAGEAG